MDARKPAAESLHKVIRDPEPNHTEVACLGRMLAVLMIDLR